MIELTKAAISGHLTTFSSMVQQSRWRGAVLRRTVAAVVCRGAAWVNLLSVYALSNFPPHCSLRPPECRLQRYRQPLWAAGALDRRERHKRIEFGHDHLGYQHDLAFAMDKAATPILVEPRLKTRPKPEPEILKPAVARSVARRGEKIPSLNPSLAEFGHPTVIHVYGDAQGLPMVAVCRYRNAQGKKDIRPYTLKRPLADGPLSWKACGPEGPLPLYGLELLAARPTAFVMFVEGEKAADAVSHLLPTMIVAPQ